MITQQAFISPNGLGCHPAPEDERDCGLYIASQHFITQPATIDYRDHLPITWNQGSTSACTAYAITAAACYQRAKQGFKYFEPSRIWTYWWERKGEGTTGTDAGANIRDGMRSMVSDGLCPLWAWPDSQTMLMLDPEATWAAQRTLEPDKRMVNGYLISEDPQFPAHHHQAKGYRAVQLTQANITAALVSGKVVVFGTNLYESFWSTPLDGIVPLPNVQTERLVGGHAMLIVGYMFSAGTMYYIVRNSWGGTFGDSGYVYIPVNWFNPFSGIANYDGWTFTSMKA